MSDPTHEPALWLVRHARVLLESGICYGSADVLADESATLIASKSLAEQVPEAWQVKVSPMKRCQQLADSLRLLRPDLRFTQDDRLKELNFGPWELRAWASIERDEFDQWMGDFAHARPGGEFAGAESVAELMARVRAAWVEWQATEEDTLWITHAGVMRAVLLLASGRQWPRSAADWPDAALAYGEMLVIPGGPHASGGPKPR